MVVKPAEQFGSKLLLSEMSSLFLNFRLHLQSILSHAPYQQINQLSFFFTNTFARRNHKLTEKAIS
jgi:hypothetical protein